MSHTTVDSKVAVAGATMYVDEKEKSLTVPPKGTAYKTTSFDEGVIEIPVGDAVVNEKAEMQTSDGRKLKITPKEVEKLRRDKEERAKMREVADKKGKDKPAER